MTHLWLQAAGRMTPAFGLTVAILVMAAAAAVALTVVIRRREHVPVVVAPLPAKVEAQRIERATTTAMPDDVQGRLRFLTGGLDVLPPKKDAARPRSTTAPPENPALADDKTRYFGPDSKQPPSAGDASIDQLDATTLFEGDALGEGAKGDATRFFGSDDAMAGQDDDTHFFDDDDRIDLSGSAASDGSTQLFDDAGAGAPNDDATGFLAVDDHDGAESAGASPTSAGHRAQSTASDQPEPGSGSFRVVGSDDVGGTDFLPALPPSVPVPDTAALSRVRARLSRVREPELVAIMVLDSSGRVLAGDADDDVAGELRSLMAESGHGNMADVDQPVRLEDNARGALLLVPTGASALLGALVRDDRDPDAIRAALRGLANEIGDAMRRAS